MKLIWYGVPTVCIVFFFWIIMHDIDKMVLREKNNKFHAMLLGCTYLAPVPEINNVLYFDCLGKVQLVKEIDWIKGEYK